MDRIPDGSIDLALCDIPYAHILKSKVRKCTDNIWDTPLCLGRLWKQLSRVVKQSGIFVFTATQPFASVLVLSNPALFKYDLTWAKSCPTGFLLAKHRPMRSTEHLLVFGRSRGTYNPQKTYGHKSYCAPASTFTGNTYGDIPRLSHKSDDSRHPTSLIRVSERDLRTKFQAGAPRLKHPTQKPVDLMSWIIRSYTNAGDQVLDPTMGSGTTCVAAIQQGRRCIGIEKDEQYFRHSVERVKQAMAAPKQSEMSI